MQGLSMFNRRDSARYFVAFWCLMTWMAGVASSARAQSEAPAPRDVSSILQTVLDKSKVPGMAAVVVEGGTIVSQGAVGVRSAGATEKVTIGDKFHLGSCTKAMTATLVAGLVEEGKLAWDTTVVSVFPEEAKSWDAGWGAVTIEQLLCHRGGVPGEIPPDVWAECWKRQGSPTDQRVRLMKALLQKPPRSAPGEKYEYSNAGYAIAGAMTERVTGRGWEDLMRERLFEPLKITSAGFGAPGNQGVVDEPRGHRMMSLRPGTPPSWKPINPSVPNADNPPAIGPGGSVHMSVPDWSRFVSAHLTGEGGGSALLKPETFVRLHTPPNGWEYGMGWSTTRRGWAGEHGEGKVLVHSGSNTMWFCTVWMAPERGLGVMVACNGMGEGVPKACDDASWALIQDEITRRAAAKAPGGP